MANLSEDSHLFATLSNLFDERTDTNLALFNSCVDVALHSSKREIRYVLFSLKCLYGEIDSGVSQADAIQKVIRVIAGDSMKASFIMAVLDAALDEM